MEITKDMTLEQLFEMVTTNKPVNPAAATSGNIREELLDTEDSTSIKISQNVNAAIKTLKVISNTKTTSELLADIFDSYINNLMNDEDRKNFHLLYKQMVK